MPELSRQGVLTNLQPGLAVALWGLAAYFLLSQWLFFYQFHVHIPVKDTWRLLPLMQTILEQGWREVDASQWLQAHAGAHRIALTRLLMALDYVWLGGRNHLLYLSAALSLAALLFIYCRALRSVCGIAWPMTLSATAIVVIWLSTPSQFFNLVNPINASWYTAMVFSVVALQFLLKAPPGGSWRSIAAAWLFAALAALSNFSGLIVWFLLPAAGLLRRDAAWMVATLAVASGACVFAYLAGIESTIGIIQNNSEVNSAARAAWEESGRLVFWLQFAGSVAYKSLVYLGAPLTSAFPGAGVCLVAASLFFLGWCGWQLREPLGGEWVPALFLLTAVLCVGVAAATQLGRLYIGGADALRYQGVVMLYWLNVSGLLLWLRVPAGDSPTWQGLTACLGLIAALVIVPMGSVGSSESRFVNEALMAEQLGAVGLYQSGYYRSAFPARMHDPQPAAAEFFRRHGLANRQRHAPPATDSAADCVAAGSLHLQRGVLRQGSETVGFAVPRLPGDATLLNYLLLGDRGWTGFATRPLVAEVAVDLIYTPLIGKTRRCAVEQVEVELIREQQVHD